MTVGALQTCEGTCSCNCPSVVSPTPAPRRPLIPEPDTLLRHYKVRVIKPLDLPSDAMTQPDDRTSAIAMGTAAIIVMVICAVGIVVVDASSLLRDVKVLKRNLASGFKYMKELCDDTALKLRAMYH